MRYLNILQMKPVLFYTHKKKIRTVMMRRKMMKTRMRMRMRRQHGSGSAKSSGRRSYDMSCHFRAFLCSRKMHGLRER